MSALLVHSAEAFTWTRSSLGSIDSDQLRSAKPHFDIIFNPILTQPHFNPPALRSAIPLQSKTHPMSCTTHSIPRTQRRKSWSVSHHLMFWPEVLAPMPFIPNPCNPPPTIRCRSKDCSRSSSSLPMQTSVHMLTIE